MLKYGIIGSGQMGSEHILSLRAIPGIEIVAIADPNEKSRELASLMLGPDNQTTSFDNHNDLLSSGLCDAVVIATPNMTHEHLVIEAMRQNIHILVEKPLSTTLKGCDNIIKEAATSKSLVWVGMEYRFMPAISRLISMSQEGFAGDLHMISMQEHRFPFLDKVNNWNRFNENTGGTLVEKCCHFFDLMRLIAGCEAISVFASGGRDVNHLNESYSGMTPDILDNAFVVVNFEHSIRAMLDLCMFAEGSEDEHRVSVVGDRGKISISLPSNTISYGKRTKGRQGVIKEQVSSSDAKYVGFHHGSTYFEHLAFQRAILENERPKVSVEDGYKAVAIGIAAELSIKEGKPITLANLY